MQQKHPNQRKFICTGCTKSFLSYPALYTHIKKKHESQAQQMLNRYNEAKKKNLPEQIQIPRKMLAFPKSKEQSELMSLIDAFYCELTEKQEFKESCYFGHEDRKILEFHEQTANLKEALNLGQLLRQKNDDRPLKASQLKIHLLRFKLNLREQITKNYKALFAAKISVQLDIIENYEELAKHKSLSVTQIQSQIWGEKLQMPSRIKELYMAWNKICSENSQNIIKSTKTDDNQI